VASLGKLLTPVYSCHQAVQFGTRQGAVTLFSWKGKHGLAESNGSL